MSSPTADHDRRPDAPGRILVVEDDEDDLLFLRRAFERVGLRAPISAVTDGDAAVAYLAGTGPYADRAAYPPAERVLLDLKLPRRSGLEVLRWIRSHPAHRELPVILLTSSDDPSDVAAGRALGIDAYLVKPVGFGELVQVAREIVRAWEIP
ncbi:MAG: response regulator, partial [Myxococcota bacterium]